MSYFKEYEWTALTEADLLDQGGNGSSIGCGDVFTMPGSATVCMSTRDNDYSLSGDNYQNENANDQSGQWAKIDGEPVGGQMYAESYHVLQGSDGQTYYMIEIEIEGHNAPGAGDDYFTFYGDVPPEGTELTVVQTCNVTGNWVDYKCLGAGDKVETGSISGTVFCDVDCDGINGEVNVIPGCDYTIEAEDMYSNGFQVVAGSQASGGELAKLNCAGGSGALWTCFDGKSGTYDVTIRVQDENDGQSIIKLKVNGAFVEAVRLNGDTDGGGSNDDGFSTYVIKDVAIQNGDYVTLKARGDGGEYVRIDNLVLEGQDEVETVSEPTKAGVTIKLLDLDGNVVATTQTDADGNYSFDDVVAGDYKIMGVAPDGTEFTIQDAGSDDTIDSDVDENGMSGVITVTGDSETDIDLGVCEKPEPGSLSGRYFCDTDDDNQDNNNGAEPGIAGVVVMLLDANGVPTGATTVTDSNGNYAFTGLVAGTYGVKFTDPDGVLEGKTLIDANVGDDASDSDAIGDADMSTIMGITVEAGQDTPDNDAGVEIANTDPTPQDDAGKTCADETVMIDVLANDSDPDGDTLTITAVDGQDIAEGETITTGSGVDVTLSGGQLIFDGEDAFEFLDIGEQATDSVSYTVSDGNGGSASAMVDVTYCGDANSVDSLLASFPASGSYQVITDGVELPVEGTAFALKLDGTGDSRFDGVVFEKAYCLSLFDPAGVTEDFSDAPVHTANILAGTDASVFNADQTSFANGQSAAENLDLINWLINQDLEGANGNAVDGEFSGWEVQRAIWELTDNLDTDYQSDIDPGFGNDLDVDYLVDLALANGEGFEAGTGDLISFIVDPNPITDDNSQPFIAAVRFEDYDCIC